jgi:hypothetical protein
VASRSGCSKTERTKVATIDQFPFEILEAKLAIKCDRQRCQVAPDSTVAIAAFIPPWASEITNSTPARPRATRERRNSVHPAVSSVVTMSNPMISRRPSALAAVAITADTFTTRPPSRIRCASASIHK